MNLFLTEKILCTAYSEDIGQYHFMEIYRNGEAEDKRRQHGRPLRFEKSGNLKAQNKVPNNEFDREVKIF